MDQVKLLSEPVNYAVVHLPRRRFPGVVFQGDSLAILIHDLEEALQEQDVDERDAMLSYVLAHLREVQAGYETVLKREGMSLPYSRR